MENKSIMNLAEKVSKDLKNQNINPMELMSGLMTGKNIMQNKKFANLVTNLSKEIETKIETGELDLKELGIVGSGRGSSSGVQQGVPSTKE